MYFLRSFDLKATPKPPPPDVHVNRIRASKNLGRSRPLTKVFYDLDTKVESATGRGTEGKTDVCI